MFLNAKSIDSGNETTRWLNILINMLMYIHTYLMDMLWISLWWWWLRSTTSPYGRTFLEVAYEEIIFHSTETAWVIRAREKWLGYRHETSLMVNTSVGTVYNIFWFSWYKNKFYMYYVLKSIHIINEHWWSLTLSSPDKVQRIFFDRP